MTKPERVILAIGVAAVAVMPVAIGIVMQNAQRAFVARTAAHCTDEGGTPYRAIESEDVVCLFEPTILREP